MDHFRTVIIADHHKTVFVCRIVDNKTGETEMKRLRATRAELDALLLSLKGPILLFVEACRSWEWVSDLCEDRGVEMRLVDASKMPERPRRTALSWPACRGRQSRRESSAHLHAAYLTRRVRGSSDPLRWREDSAIAPSSQATTSISQDEPFH